MARIVVCDVCDIDIREGSYKFISIQEESLGRDYNYLYANKDLCNQCYTRLLNWELTNSYQEEEPNV